MNSRLQSPLLALDALRYSILAGAIAAAAVSAAVNVARAGASPPLERRAFAPCGPSAQPEGVALDSAAFSAGEPDCARLKFGQQVGVARARGNLVFFGRDKKWRRVNSGAAIEESGVLKTANGSVAELAVDASSDLLIMAPNQTLHLEKGI